MLMTYYRTFKVQTDVWKDFPQNEWLVYHTDYIDGLVQERRNSMGKCKKDVTPLLSHWSYIFLALTHQYLGELMACDCRIRDIFFLSTTIPHLRVAPCIFSAWREYNESEGTYWRGWWIIWTRAEICQRACQVCRTRGYLQSPSVDQSYETNHSDSCRHQCSQGTLESSQRDSCGKEMKADINGYVPGCGISCELAVEILHSCNKLVK